MTELERKEANFLFVFPQRKEYSNLRQLRAHNRKISPKKRISIITRGGEVEQISTNYKGVFHGYRK